MNKGSEKNVDSIGVIDDDEDDDDREPIFT